MIFRRNRSGHGGIMSKKKSKKKTKRTYTAVQDIEKLLAAEPPAFSVITGAAGCHKNKIDTEEAARQRMRSDESISFAWCKGSSIIHDKTCDLINKANIYKIQTSGTYDSSMKQCPHCMAKAYLRAGGNVSEKSTYMKFFERTDIDGALMRRLFINDNAKTQISSNVLTVIMNEDTWKLKALDDRNRSVELLQNEFEIKNGKRIFADGFHIVRTGMSAEEAFRFMERYDWKKHRIRDAVKKCFNAVSGKFDILRNKFGKRLDMLRERMDLSCGGALYYVDGDNTPKERINGIENLTSRDIVKIFYAEGSSCYDDVTRQEELIERCECSISFISVEPGSNAVDFAIAMDAYHRCMTAPGCHIYLLSADRHFTVIKKQIQAMADCRTEVMHLGSVAEAHRSYERQCSGGIRSCWPGYVK